MARKKTKKRIDISICTVISLVSFLALAAYLYQLVSTNQYAVWFADENAENPLMILTFAPLGIVLLFSLYEKLKRGFLSLIPFLLMAYLNATIDDANLSVYIFYSYFLVLFILTENIIVAGANDRYYESPFDRNITFSNSYSTPDYLSSGCVPYGYSSSSSSSDSYTSSSSDYSDSYGSSYSGYTDSYGTSRPLTFQEKCDYTDHLCGGLYTYGGIEKIENDPYLTPEQKEDLKRHYMIYGD